MSRRALSGVLLAAFWTFAWPALAVAQDPETASSAAGACAAACEASPAPGESSEIVPSAPGRLAEGHGDQSTPVLAGLALIAFGGLVIAVLNQLALDESEPSAPGRRRDKTDAAARG